MSNWHVFSGPFKALLEHSSVLTGPLVVALSDTNFMKSTPGIHLPSEPVGLSNLEVEASNTGVLGHFEDTIEKARADAATP